MILSPNFCECSEVEVAMNFELKPLSLEAIPRALAKAERYRLLNEPGEAESICRDALQVDPDNDQLRAMLVLALTDQFDESTAPMGEALKVAVDLHDPYERAYYTGIVWERKAKAQLRRESLGLGPEVYAWLREAMDWFERAEALRPAGNDDAVLRWNCCARLIMKDHRLVPESEEHTEPLFLE
jgi:tetratricopeptide (TPR) repeat protein